MEVNRLFDNHNDLGLEEISKVVNKYVDSHLELLDNVEIITKWTSMPAIFVEKREVRRAFVNEVINIDELFMDEERKIKMIITLACMVTNVGVAIEQIDLNSLYMLVDFFTDIPNKEYERDIIILGNPTLLESIRRSTIDVDLRKELLSHILDEYKDEDASDLNKVHEFQKKINSDLKKKKCFTILGKTPYMEMDNIESDYFD